MANSTFGMFIAFPGAPHEGNGTGVVLVDAQIPAARRAVLEVMIQQIPPESSLAAFKATRGLACR